MHAGMQACSITARTCLHAHAHQRQKRPKSEKLQLQLLPEGHSVHAKASQTSGTTGLVLDFLTGNDAADATPHRPCLPAPILRRK